MQRFGYLPAKDQEHLTNLNISLLFDKVPDVNRDMYVLWLTSCRNLTAFSLGVGKYALGYVVQVFYVIISQLMFTIIWLKPKQLSFIWHSACSKQDLKVTWKWYFVKIKLFSLKYVFWWVECTCTYLCSMFDRGKVCLDWRHKRGRWSHPKKLYQFFKHINTSNNY